MEYTEIKKIKDIYEKNIKLQEFYKENIKVNDWLTNEPKQKILFKDRIEYKVNNKLHRLNGPAIEFLNDTGNSQYYLNGELLSEADWKINRVKV